MTTQPKQTTRSEEVVRKHKEYLWPAVTNFYQAAAGGRSRLDAIRLGRRRPQVSRFLRRHPDRLRGPRQSQDHRAVKAQVDQLQHLSTLYPNEAIVAWPKKSRRSLRARCKTSFFTSSGTEANEAAILLARMATGSFDVVALRHAYSGGSSLTKSVTAQAPWRKSGIISVGIAHAINPYCYRCPLGLKYPGLRSRLREGRRKSDPDRHQRPHRRVHRRADSGRRRIHHAAAGIFQDRFQGREEIRRPVHLR